MKILYILIASYLLFSCTEKIPSGDVQFYEYEVTSSSIKILKYLGNESSLIIPTSIDGINVISIGNNSFSNNETLNSIILGESIESIESNAFRSCINLKVVSLNDNLKKIDDFAFSGCINLENINFPKSLESIGMAILAQCDNIIEIQIDTKSEHVINIFEQAFPLLETITTPIETENLSAIDGVLFSKNGDTLLKYPSGRKELFYKIPEIVNTIGSGAFESNDYLQKISISDNVISIKPYAFSNCNNLSEVFPPTTRKNIKLNIFLL